MHTHHTQAVESGRNLNESTQGAYNTPSREGVIKNKLFAYREKDHNQLNKYFIPSKLSLKVESNPVSM